MITKSERYYESREKHTCTHKYESHITLFKELTIWLDNSNNATKITGKIFLIELDNP